MKQLSKLVCFVRAVVTLGSNVEHIVLRVTWLVVHSFLPLSIFNASFVYLVLTRAIIGHCHACKDYRPMMVHPSSRAYGGGNTSVIDYPNEDSSSSDSDY